jgi:Tfp pilus assembly protein PilZ
MYEKRRAFRLEEENEIIITIISEGENTPKEKIYYNYIKDMSVYGAKIQANVFLPVDTLLMMEMKLRTLRQTITVFGKVKWIKMIIENESYEAGVEFFYTSSDESKKLANYISSKQQSTRIYLKLKKLIKNVFLLVILVSPFCRFMINCKY